jgi:RNA polymerase sigma factor (sigma-70 family)
MSDTLGLPSLRFGRLRRHCIMSLPYSEVVLVGVDAGAHVARLVTDHYERRGRALFGLARRSGLSDDEAADVLQETHLRLFRELTAGATIDDLDAWSFRVAYRLSMDHHRLGRRLRALVSRIGEGRASTRAAATDDALSIWPAVDRLPPRERTTLYLRYRTDLSFEQIGEVMGIAPGTARTYASRGLERLRESLSSTFEGAGDG